MKLIKLVNRVFKLPKNCPVVDPFNICPHVKSETRAGWHLPLRGLWLFLPLSLILSQELLFISATIQSRGSNTSFK